MNLWINRIKNLVTIRSGRTDSLLDLILDSLFPKPCPACKHPLSIPSDAPLCNECIQHVRPINGAVCIKCGIPFPAKTSLNHLCSHCTKNNSSLDWARSIFIYHGPIAILIKRFKYHDDRACLNALLQLSRPYLDQALNGIPFDLYNRSSKTCIIPVPLHPKRLKKRLFNQSLLIAKGLFEYAPICLDLVQRTIDNPPQSNLGLEERKRNVRGIFRVKGLSDFENFLLVDDVMTSGSTLNELAKALKNHGARCVAALTIARTV